MDPADYVLRDFSAREASELGLVVATAADAIETIATHGLAVAQQRFHA
jgi:PTH1 family peptidyl-tRNA hydrolase